MKKLNRHIVLIRGLTKEALHWGEAIESLRVTCPDYQIMTLDIPGAGVFYKDKSPLSIDEMVLRMREEFLSKLSAHEDHECYLVAISLGGMIASSWLNEFSYDFKKAVLINTSFGQLSPFYKRLYLNCVPKLIQIAMTRDIEKKEELTLELVSNIEEKRESAKPLWTEIAKIHPVSLSNTLRQFWAAWTFEPKIEWDTPTLILASKKDRMVSCDCSEKIHEEYGFPIIYHPEAGHALAVDDPTWLADQVAFWVGHENA